MASSVNLEERFNVAVQTIQNLPANGSLQPSNLTKLIFYGLYKQATLGPCTQPQPSMFNYVNRAKWEAWDRCRLMTKEQAMLEYIDEIRKIIKTMPQTNEVLEVSRLIGLSDKSTENVQQQTTLTEDKETRFESFVNDISDDDHKEPPLINTNEPTQTLVSARNDQVLSSSSSISSSSISSSDIDEFYDDPSDLLIFSYDEIASDNSIQQQSRLHHSSTQNGTNAQIRHSNLSSTRSPSFHPHNPSNTTQYSTSPGGANGRYPTNNHNKETQRAILTALTTLQRDINNILERLNRLETSAYLLQQRELVAASELDSSLRWLPLSGFRRGAIAFILLWPFVAFALIRLYLRAKIIIRFRRQHL